MEGAGPAVPALRFGRLPVMSRQSSFLPILFAMVARIGFAAPGSPPGSYGP